MASVKRGYPRLEVDEEAELAYYKRISEKVVPLIADTIEFTNAAFDAGQKILVEGALVCLMSHHLSLSLVLLWIAP